jgi:hypothetical protein
VAATAWRRGDDHKDSKFCLLASSGLSRIVVRPWQEHRRKKTKCCPQLGLTTYDLVLCCIYHITNHLLVVMQLMYSYRVGAL